MGDEHEDRYDLSAPLPVQEKRIQFSVKKSASTHSLLSARQLISDCEKGQANSNFKIDSSDSSVLASDRGSVVVLEHLQRYASTFGLKPNDPKADCRSTVIDIHPPEDHEENHRHNDVAQEHISWKKLHMLRPKLKTASNTSALMAGFAMAAVVELQLSTTQIGELPAPLLVIFALCTSMLVAVHMLVLLISTCILPSMDGVSNLRSVNLVNESPHERLQRYIEFAWFCSTILGILLFMIEVAIVCWIQFWNVLQAAAFVASAVVFVFLCIFAWFAWMIYRVSASHSYEHRQMSIRHLEMMHAHTDVSNCTSA